MKVLMRIEIPEDGYCYGCPFLVTGIHKDCGRPDFPHVQFACSRFRQGYENAILPITDCGNYGPLPLEKCENKGKKLSKPIQFATCEDLIELERTTK